MTKSKFSKNLYGNFGFLLLNFFCSPLKTKKKNLSKNEQKLFGHLKKSSESFENCTTSDVGILNAHVSYFFFIKDHRPFTH